MGNDNAAVGGSSPRCRPPFRWLGHATVLLPGEPTVAVDPWRWRLGDVADVVLVTCGHVDHCSEDDLVAARREGAAVIVPGAVADRLRAAFGDAVVVLGAGEIYEREGLRVTALPSEGPTRDGRRSGFLPRGTGNAYLVETAAGRVLFLGDSVVLPEHVGHAPDLAFVAVGGLVTATPEEAADMVARLAAGVVVPVHWGDLEARHGAAERFVELCAERGVTAATSSPGGSAPDGEDHG